MTIKQIKDSISYCGLICCLCGIDGSCDCKEINHCGKKASPEGCFQYICCRERGFNGCWECDDFSCDKDMFNEQHIRLKTFVKCIKEDGIDMFTQYILHNCENGIMYHRNGDFGDYDLDTEEEILHLLRTGETRPK
jgi:hypothetical protein